MKLVYRHTTYYVYHTSMEERLGYIYSIPPICSCTDYNISKSNII